MTTINLWQRIKCFFGLHQWMLVSYDPDPTSCGWVEYHECEYCETEKL